MKRLSVLTICIIGGIGILLQGCQSRQDEAAKEKEKRFWKDATPEKYMAGKAKPQKPYWDKTK
jgi:IMP dehydrogenase/GMP reductase